jgi:engulfment and cell motility protein 1
MEDPEFFSNMVLEQNGRPPERRCSIARASNEIVELLAEHWAIFAPGCTSHRNPHYTNVNLV